MGSPYPYGSAPHDGAPLQPPRRRERAIQPPSLLTTSLNNAQNFGLGLGPYASTPLSTTTLSTPFSVHHQSPYPASPGGASRGTSPMALRSAVGTGGPYNPQQWGPISNENTTMPATGPSFTAAQRFQSTRVTTVTTQPTGPDGKSLFLVSELLN